MIDRRCVCVYHNAMSTYKAVFSDGVVTRNTDNVYRTAWRTRDYAYKPPKILGTGFSSSLKPSGAPYKYGSLSYLSANERDKVRAKLKDKNKLVKTEVIKVVKIK